MVKKEVLFPDSTLLKVVFPDFPRSQWIDHWDGHTEKNFENITIGEFLNLSLGELRRMPSVGSVTIGVWQEVMEVYGASWVTPTGRKRSAKFLQRASRNEEIARYYQGVLSLRKTAENFGMTLENVRKILRRSSPDLVQHP